MYKFFLKNARIASIGKYIYIYSQNKESKYFLRERETTLVWSLKQMCIVKSQPKKKYSVNRLN